MSARLEVRLEKERYVPGDAVRGTVFVAEGGRSRSLEAFLEYREQTEDYKETARSVSSGPLHVGDVTTGMAFAFDLPLPVDALPNYRSENGELYWEVHVKAADVLPKPIVPEVFRTRDPEDQRGPDLHERSRIEVELGPPTEPASPVTPGPSAPTGMGD